MQVAYQSCSSHLKVKEETDMMDDVVAMVGIVGLVVFGVVAIVKGLRPKIKAGPDGVSAQADQ
jgi:hypothetical protein